MSQHSSIPTACARRAHVFGAISLDDAKFTFQSAPVFNGKTFREFLRLLVRRYARCSISRPGVSTMALG
jgi:hypothetical protein